MAFAHSTAIINHLIMGYKFPDNHLASENQFNQPQHV